MQDQPSQTAMGSAVLRAAHVRDDDPPWILEDTVSEQLLSDDERRIISEEIASWPPGVAPAFRISHVARTRLAEDVAIDGIDVGRRRYVLLGAGLDSFAWRHPRASALEVVEIDHPVTQAWKRRRLASRGLGEPPNVRFVPVDLAEAPLDSFECRAHATWSWLGVTMYLERPAVSRVLAQIASGPGGTTLVVNFLLPGTSLDDSAKTARATSARTVARSGEPIRSTYTRQECEAVLEGAGFGSVELFDAGALQRRYLGDRRDLWLPATTLIAVASV